MAIPIGTLLPTLKQRKDNACARAVPAQIAVVVVALALWPFDLALGQTIWSGFEVEFSKSDFADQTQPENQDRITDNVWLTRGTNQGLFNAAQEDGWAPAGTSPADTLWATDINNLTGTIAATNWSQLNFTHWIEAYGGFASMDLPLRLTERNAVVHLVTDNVYLDLQFTGWTELGGGGFSYQRATGDLPPSGPTGDYNFDGVVDAADYTAWRDTLDQIADPPGSGADGDESGVIDEGDFIFWKERFGTVVAESATVTAVPEPATTLLALLGAILVSSVQRNRP